MRTTRVLLVDDHVFVRKGVAAILENQPGWEICGEAATGRDAVAAAAQLNPDVVVMDIFMPDMNGLEATRQILKNNPKIEVLILSIHQSEQIVRDALAAGARGYVLKTDASRELLAGLESLRAHKPFFTSKAAEVLLRGYLAACVSSQLPSVSPREREILQLVAEGKANKEVAAILNISVKTVETHRARIMSKLHLRSISDLVRYAIRNNIIEG